MTRRRKVKKQPVALTLAIDTIGAGGDGVGHHKGKAVYVPKTTPGDVVRVRAEENAEGYYGQVVSIETPSAARVSAPCPHYEVCGGCALQHISLSDYQAWKDGKVRTTLERAGVVPQTWEAPVFLPAATRRRTTLAVLRTTEQFFLGYHEPRSRQITPVLHCLILDPALDQKIQEMRPYLKRLAPLRTALDITVQYVEGCFDVVLSGDWGENGFLSLEQNEILSEMAHELDLARIGLRGQAFESADILLSRRPIIKHFGALQVSLPPGAFLQASVEGETVLAERVLKYAGRAKHVADLFSGCGTFTGTLLKGGAEVFAADHDIAALDALRHPKLVTQRRNLFNDALSFSEINKFDAVVLDPPRAGAKEQFRVLADSNVPVVISVSCNPATFARDARMLMDGGYVLRSLCLIDQFVWSSHVELIGLFTHAV